MRTALIAFIVGTAFGAILSYVLIGGSDDAEPKATREAAMSGKATRLAEPPPAEMAATAMSATPRGPDNSQEACLATLEALRQAHARALVEEEQNEELIAFLAELVEKSGASSPSGNPMDFPQGLAAAYTPEKFKESVERLKEECSDVFPQDTIADCSEFPCAIRFSDDKSAQHITFHEACPIVTELFGNSGSSSSSGSGSGDEKTYLTELIPAPSGEGVADYMREYQDNLQKRSRHRFDEWIAAQAYERHGAACTEENDPAACRQLGRQLQRSHPEDARTYLEKSCELGEANECNSLAWRRCHDNAQCDDEALRLANRAAALDPSSGAILDTLAFVLCARGATSQADQWYVKSCEAGMPESCDKTCER